MSRKSVLLRSGESAPVSVPFRRQLVVDVGTILVAVTKREVGYIIRGILARYCSILYTAVYLNIVGDKLLPPRSHQAEWHLKSNTFVVE